MRFEYKQLIFNVGIMEKKKKQDELEETLNDLGRDGWEIVNFHTIGDTPYFVYLFKRQLRNEF